MLEDWDECGGARALIGMLKQNWSKDIVGEGHLCNSDIGEGGLFLLQVYIDFVWFFGYR
jgi:hypothetical protein